MSRWLTGKIRMEALGIKVNLDKNQYFADCGFVPNPEEHLKELCSKEDYEKAKNKLSPNDVGYSLWLSEKDYNGKPIEYVIFFCSDDYSNVQKHFLKAHEETHALQYFGKTEGLYSQIEKITTLPKGESRMTKDRIADLAGIFGLVNSKKYATARIILNASCNINLRDFPKAMKIAMQNKK